MKLIKLILSYFPSKIPSGMTAYSKWQSDIIELAGPIADERSLRWAIANMVMHAPSDSAYLSKQYFLRRLVKTAANQLSAQVFQDIKAEQEQENKAAQEAADAAAKALQPVEATTPPQVVANEEEAVKP